MCACSIRSMLKGPRGRVIVAALLRLRFICLFWGVGWQVGVGRFASVDVRNKVCCSLRIIEKAAHSSHSHWAT